MTQEGIRHELVLPESVKAPVAEGQSIGKLVVYQGTQVIKEYELKAGKLWQKQAGGSSLNVQQARCSAWIKKSFL